MEWAVGVIYRQMHPRLVTYLRAREPRAADDLEAEVWLAVAERLGRFEGGEEALRAWIFSIAQRRLANYRRTAARHATLPVPDDELDRAAPDETEAHALGRLSTAEEAAFVTAVLPSRHAEVVLLRMLGDLDVEHVARLLGERPGTVRVLQHRALQRLRTNPRRLRNTTTAANDPSKVEGPLMPDASDWQSKVGGPLTSAYRLGCTAAPEIRGAHPAGSTARSLAAMG